MLGREPRRRLAIDRRAMAEQARRLLTDLDAQAIPTQRLVRRLTVAQRQTVEIAKALSYRPRILVMDEPTAALTPGGPPGPGSARLAVRGGRGGTLGGIDIEVREREIVGVGGLDGSGRSDLARAVFGVMPFASGTVEIDGVRRRIRSPRAAIRAGL